MTDTFKFPSLLHSHDLERTLIGACLVDPLQVAECGLTGREFHLRAHALIWAVLQAAAPNCDVALVARELERQGQLEAVGGLAYLVGAAADTGAAYLATDYAAQVRRDYHARELLALATETAKAAHDPARDPLDTAATLAHAAGQLAQASASVSLVTAEAAAQTAYARLAEYVERGVVPGIMSGFHALDNIGGRRRGECITLAGRPGMGKSSFAGSLAYHDAQAGLRVAVCSLEMAPDAWAEQYIATHAGLNLPKARAADLQRFGEYVAEARSLPLAYYGRGYCSPAELERNVHAIARHLGGLDVLYVDHLGYIAHDTSGGLRPTYAIGVTLKRLVRLVREYNACGVILSQLNRDSERESREPRLPDLRESGEIEQDSRQVWFLHRPHYHEQDRDAHLPEDAHLIVAKNNSGPTGRVKLAYVRALRRFAEWAPNAASNGASPRPAPAQRPAPAARPAPVAASNLPY